MGSGWPVCEREVAPLPQLRDAQPKRTQQAIAVTVAPGRALAAALVAPGADQHSTLASINSGNTASATVRRKSPSPAFSSSSDSANFSSVIFLGAGRLARSAAGSPSTAGLGRRNVPIEHACPRGLQRKENGDGNQTERGAAVR